MTGWSVGWKCFLINKDPIGSEKMAQGHCDLYQRWRDLSRKALGNIRYSGWLGLCLKGDF